MQTFLPYPDFVASMRVLDMRRLGKQRVEAYQILNTITGISSGWKNHPAVKMWVGYEESLKHYTNAAIIEWKRRGYKNTMKTYDVDPQCARPPWIGDESLHISHQSNLVRKFPEHYQRYFPEVTNNLPYYWPV